MSYQSIHLTVPRVTRLLQSWLGTNVGCENGTWPDGVLYLRLDLLGREVELVSFKPIRSLVFHCRRLLDCLEPEMAVRFLLAVLPDHCTKVSLGINSAARNLVVVLDKPDEKCLEREAADEATYFVMASVSCSVAYHLDRIQATAIVLCQDHFVVVEVPSEVVGRLAAGVEVDRAKTFQLWQNASNYSTRVPRSMHTRARIADRVSRSVQSWRGLQK